MSDDELLSKKMYDFANEVSRLVVNNDTLVQVFSEIKALPKNEDYYANVQMILKKATLLYPELGHHLH